MKLDFVSTFEGLNFLKLAALGVEGLYFISYYSFSSSKGKASVGGALLSCSNDCIVSWCMLVCLLKKAIQLKLSTYKMKNKRFWFFIINNNF